jgi:trimeric autotransporter adhesin
MKSLRASSLLLVVLFGAIGAQSQQPAPLTSNQAAAVPHLVRFTGTLHQENGKPLTGVAGVTFALYKEDQGGAALWIETQNVQLDSSGHYSVMLGATKPDGLPADLFVSSDARWLGVQAEGEPEQARVLLVSVPYAMKAADAETVGGLPASAFLRAPQPGSKATEASAATAAQAGASIGGTGRINFLPIWTGTGTLSSSTLFEKGGKLGLGTIAPATTLDVNGAATIRGDATITGTLSTPNSLAAGSGGFSGNNTSQILNVAQAGSGKGIYASTSSSANSSTALYGAANAATGNTRGVVGLSSSNTGIGVQGGAGGFGSGTSTGVYGFSISSAGTGVSGVGSTGVSGSGNSVGGLFQATGSSALVLKGLNPSGMGIFSVDGKGNLSTAGSLVGGGAFVSGNALGTMIGDPGCGSGTAAIGFGSAGFSPCSNYALRGDSGGNLYLNSSSTGWMFFDHGNTGLMSLDPSGNLGVQGNVHASGGGSNSFSITADNNAQQARAAGGWVKAMAYVDPFVSGGIAITRCYNSQMTGAATTTPPCGMSVTHFGQGDNVIDFGFEVNDRFVSVTTSGNSATVGSCFPSTFNGGFLTANQQDIFTYVSYNQGSTCDVPFYVFVY